MKRKYQQAVQLELFATQFAPTGTPAPSVQLDVPVEPEAGASAGAAQPDVPVEPEARASAGAAQSDVPVGSQAGSDAGAAKLEVPVEPQASASAGAAQSDVPVGAQAGSDAGAAQSDMPAEAVASSSAGAAQSDVPAEAQAGSDAGAVKRVSKKQSRKKQSPDRPAVSPQAQQSAEEIVVPYAGIASKSEQSPDKPVVKCHIRIEKIGVTKRGNTPYIVYHTQYGKCCTFLSREYFLQSLLNLLGIKQQRFDSVTGFAVSELSVALLEGEKRHSIAGDELRAFLARQNQMALDGLEVRLQEGKVSVWNRASRRLHAVTSQGCNCEDAMYSKQICKHQIAAHLHLQKLGWGSLEGYLQLDYSTMPTEQLMAIGAECMADLGW